MSLKEMYFAGMLTGVLIAAMGYTLWLTTVKIPVSSRAIRTCQLAGKVVKIHALTGAVICKEDGR